eukprot:CAMPEP_0204604090 /NCGR_PEP_ID=MMETSP0661-20131031/57648_1 /ASSEMBLY_ACC=CAM_ASM_000606 /TAXON_ID=109239 /ORGANISM="Alexandrium margalefi, Strain AMGDE01CS-322" /LENGTH=62 /DNA_ID=CAMNT_0051615217 /DNA_START=74 /DNA_END=259 /DNA_ORIENTATION=-
MAFSILSLCIGATAAALLSALPAVTAAPAPAAGEALGELLGADDECRAAGEAGEGGRASRCA